MRRTAFLLAMAALALAPSTVLSQRRPAARGRPPAATAAAPAAGAQPQQQLTLAQAREALRTNDVDRVLQAINSLTVIGTADVIPPLVELLRSGPPDRITDAIVEKLGIIGRPEAIEELGSLLHHRRTTVRRGAIRALAQIHDPRVRPLIESGLHDSEGDVRGEAATALGEIGAHQSVTLLFRAFDRGVPDAAESIGRLGEASTAVSPEPAHDREDPATTRRPRTLAMYLGHAPLQVLLRGFEQFLNRRDIPSATKVQIIVRLEQQASAQVRDFLQRWVTNLPGAYRGPDRARAELAIQQIRAPGGGAH